MALLVAEYDENGNLVAKYHHDGGGLMAMTRNNSSYWYAFEAIGTTRQLMDGQGQVFDAYAYDAWGNELTRPQFLIPNPFKYVGKHGYYLDTESALMLLGVRCYGAAAGRFLSLDPEQDTLNWFSYAAVNPTNLVDPSGLRCRVYFGNQQCLPCNQVRPPDPQCTDGPRPKKPCPPRTRRYRKHECDCIIKYINSTKYWIDWFCNKRMNQYPSGGGLPLAYAICCDDNSGRCTGKVFRCPPYDNPCNNQNIGGCIQRCTETHESQHVKDCQQQETNPGPVDKFWEFECRAHQAMLSCLYRMWDQYCRSVKGQRSELR